MREPARKYWFPAKRYGWGWGLPSSWQGWVVFIAWIGAFGVGSTVLALSLLRTRPGLYVLFVLAMVAILVAVCLAKGEPPRWRWGGDDKPPPP